MNLKSKRVGKERKQKNMLRNKNFTNKKSILYLVASPIGNLKEMNPRSIEVLNEVSLIACEDTRNTGFLCSHFGIKKELISLREHNESTASELVISRLEKGENVAYLSDAGYPCISDPGKILVKKVRKSGYNVSTINGASAFLNALTASSIDSTHFYFHGFLNSVSSKAKKELETLKDKKETLIFYESPHRIEKTIKNLYEVFGNRYITLARELTKLNEEYIEGYIEEFLEVDYSTIIGEIVIIVEGNNKEEEIDIENILKEANTLLKEGQSKKDVSKFLSKKYNISKNEIYDLLIK